MSYRALYRVWRPQTFEDLIGQDHVTTTLKNALREGHFSHAYLFSGPRGTGKTSAAKIMAKAVNCLDGPAAEPCNHCEACRKVMDGSLMDVVEIDAASNRGVDEIRDLRDKVKYAPSEVRYKVYIVDEVHMLTAEAFNALLKTLEEPPEHVLFILATTEPHKLPSTIISRCQRFSFRRHTARNMLHHLQTICQSQGIEADEVALATIAQVADGGMRDALSLLDQVLAFSDQTVDESSVAAVTGSVSRSTLRELMGFCLDQNFTMALETVNELLMDGLEPERLVHDLIQSSRDLLLLLAAPELQEVKERLAGESQWSSLAEQTSVERLETMLDTLIQAQQQMKWAALPRVVMEMTLVRLCQQESPKTDRSNEDQATTIRLQQQLKKLEQKVEELSRVRPSERSKPLSDQSDETIKSPGSSNNQKLAGTERLGAFLQESSPERLQQLIRSWPEVLAKVKEQKITVHAWLIDGEPVAATDERVLVAFKNKIHRDTTEKKTHKTLIEQVIQEVLGFPLQLTTVMKADWEQSRRSSKPSVSEEAVNDRGSGQPNTSAGTSDPVDCAVEWFGKDMVEITD